MDNEVHARGLVLALGSGGARGLAHIGVLQVLEEEGIPVHAVAGTSVGAEVGAFLAVGMPMQELASLAVSVDWKQTLQLFMPDLSASGGVISGKNILEFLNNGLGRNTLIENLPVGYVAVAADLETGKQVVLDRGSLVDAVRASVSVPAMLSPHALKGRLLVDGNIVNPVPFDVARNCFGGPVVAVAVNAGALSFTANEWRAPPSPQWLDRARQLLQQPWVVQAESLRQWLQGQLNNRDNHAGKKPSWSTRKVLDQARDITTAQLMHLRMELNRPDLMLVPDVRGIGPLEFYRSKEAIAAGREAAASRLPEIRDLLRSGQDSESSQYADAF